VDITYVFPAVELVLVLMRADVPDSLKSLLYRALNESNKGNWILGEETLAIDFFPRESHLFTFREPQSFFPLYHPGCDDLCQREFREIAKKVRKQSLQSIYTFD